MLTEQTEEHSYIYAGSKLLREIITTTAEDGTETEQILDFRYDNAGLPYALIYQDRSGVAETYYYITNLQGDVMYIVDEGGDEVASYEYDPYGKLLRTTGDFAETNPIRYRSYYYDTETSFYYLQSRYYDPAICRFINYDGYASTGQGLMGYNMFAYCNNNPVIYADPTGHRPIWERKYGGVTMYTDTVTSSYSKQPTSNVGAAWPYKEVEGSEDPNSPNCYAFAIGSSVNEQPGARSGRRPTRIYDIQDVGKSVEADLIALGFSVRVIDGPNAKVYDNEFKIALRVGTSPYGYNRITGELFYDYHFMRQTSTGQWAEKHGTGGTSIQHPLGLTPDTIPWTLYGVPYYDSPIIYYAVGYPEP